MLDYVPTEIVAYAEENVVDITFNEAYPSVLPFLFNGYITNSFGRHYYEFDFAISSGNNVLSADSSLVQDFPELSGSLVYCFCIRQRDSNLYSLSDIRNSIGVCYYVFVENNGDEYWRLPYSDIPEGIEDPFGSSGVIVSGDDVIWLYNFGDFLISNSSSVFEVLNYNVNGVSLLSVFFGAGFITYVGWVLFKFLVR